MKRSARDARRGSSVAFPLLHVDDDIVVADKPAGLLTVPGRGTEPALVEQLQSVTKASLRIVHRLDKDTSGVVVFARSLEAQRALSEQFLAGRVEKVYLALVSGYVAEDGQVDIPIAPTRTERMRTAKAGAGKPSVTHYRIVERVPCNTLLECRPTTGRTHQIRVHMAAIGYPLTVDPLYGGGRAVMLSEYKADYRPNRRHEERPLIERLTLHAAEITFDHPRSGERVRFEAPLPKDFRTTLTQLRRLA